MGYIVILINFPFQMPSLKKFVLGFAAVGVYGFTSSKYGPSPYKSKSCIKFKFPLWMKKVSAEDTFVVH